MKVRSAGIVTQAFILGGPEHAEKSPEWFHDACSKYQVFLSRRADGRIQAMIGTDVAQEGDWIINTPAGIRTLTDAKFKELYQPVDDDGR